jgi:hypothetical protein
MADGELDRLAVGGEVDPVDAEQRFPGPAAESLSHRAVGGRGGDALVGFGDRRGQPGVEQPDDRHVAGGPGLRELRHVG